MASKMSKAPAKKVNVAGQEHSLAYINKNEARMLRRMGGSGKPGPSGIPTYIPDDGNRGGHSDFGGDGRDGSGAPSGPSGGEYGGGDSKDASNFSLDNYDKGAGLRGQSQASLDAQKAAAEAAAKERAKQQLKDRQKASAKKSLLDYTPGGAISKYMGKVMRDYLGKQLDAENFVDAIFDQKGKYVGNVTKNFLGFNVYSGQKVVGYTGPYQNLVEQQTPDRDNDDQVEAQIVKDYGGGKLSEDKVDGINQVLPDAPDAPGDVGDGDQTELAKKKSSLGQESTIGTSAQGLLSGARTRRRSLMSGLIT